MNDLAVLLITDCVLMLLIFILISRWALKEIRNICREVRGYIKFGQITFLLVSVAMFILLFIHSIIFRSEVSKLDVFLTIIVGFMGTMLGYFFKEDTLNRLENERTQKSRLVLKQIQEINKILEELKKE